MPDKLTTIHAEDTSEEEILALEAQLWGLIDDHAIERGGPLAEALTSILDTLRSGADVSLIPG